MSEKQEPSVGFDEDKSLGSMPRLYEHIERVDLWVMAQRKQHAKDAERIAELEYKLTCYRLDGAVHTEIDELRAKLADAVGALEQYAHMRRHDPDIDAFTDYIAREALERIKG